VDRAGVETLHYLAIAMLTGIVGIVDLRIFGVAKGLPLGPLQRLMPWAVVSFAVAAVSGYALLRINPVNALGPPINVGVRGEDPVPRVDRLNDLLYFASGLKRQVDGVGAGAARLPVPKSWQVFRCCYGPVWSTGAAC